MSTAAQSEIFSDVRKSLEAIATLLLMLHELYFTNVSGDDSVFQSLLLFIEDLGLVGASLCQIDAEAFRRQVITNNSSEFDYESFYAWLQLVARRVYGSSSGMAMQKLLTHDIVPFATSGLLPSPMRSSISMKELDLFLEYREFLWSWFISISNEVGEFLRSDSLCSYCFPRFFCFSSIVTKSGVIDILQRDQRISNCQSPLFLLTLCVTAF